MNKIKKQLSIAFVIVFALSLILTVSANAASQSTICGLPLTSTSNLATGDKITFKNLNNSGSTYFSWAMGGHNGFFPVMKLSTTSDAFDNFFTVTKLPGTNTYNLYLVSPYDGFKYYLYSDAASNIGLKRDDNGGTTGEFKWILNGPSASGTYSITCGNPSIPVSVYLYAAPTQTAPSLASGQAGPTGGLKWEIKKAVPVTVTYTKTSVWSGGLQGEIKITNNSSQTIKNWSIGFYYSNTINSIWNATLVSNTYGKYLVKNPGSYQQDIAPGASVTFGFNATAPYPDAELGYAVVVDNR